MGRHDHDNHTEDQPSRPPGRSAREGRHGRQAVRPDQKGTVKEVSKGSTNGETETLKTPQVAPSEVQNNDASGLLVPFRDVLMMFLDFQKLLW